MAMSTSDAGAGGGGRAGCSSRARSNNSHHSSMSSDCSKLLPALVLLPPPVWCRGTMMTRGPWAGIISLGVIHIAIFLSLHESILSMAESTCIWSGCGQVASDSPHPHQRGVHKYAFEPS